MILFRKILLAGFLTSLISSANGFQGFYSGITAHHTFREVQTAFPSQIIEHDNMIHRLSPIDKNSKKGYWGGSLIGGYGILKGLFHYSTEAEIETPNEKNNTYYSSSLSKSDSSLISTQAGIVPNTTNPNPNPKVIAAGDCGACSYRTVTSFKRGWAGSLSQRFGTVINNTNLIYFKVALEGSPNTFTYAIHKETPSGNTITTKKIRKFQVNIVPGIGLENKINSNLIVRSEYSYHHGNKLKIENVSNSYKAHKVKFGLLYYFR